MPKFISQQLKGKIEAKDSCFIIILIKSAAKSMFFLASVSAMIANYIDKA